MVNEQIQPHCALCFTEEAILSLLKQQTIMKVLVFITLSI